LEIRLRTVPPPSGRVKALRNSLVLL
jgi:hypothetical protein